LSDEELIAKYDQAMGNVQVGLDYYRAELLRRESARAATELIRLTRGLWFLTVAVALAAVVALIIALVR
jgi:hypothetical protein